MSDSESDESGTPRRWIERVADMFSGEPTSRSELMETLRYAADRDLIDVDVLNILFGAIAVADMHARDVMIPRSQLVFVKADMSPLQFLPIVIGSQHSRFPVIGDDVDDVRGILHAKDILPLLMQDDWDDFDIKDCMRPAAVDSRKQAAERAAAGFSREPQSYGGRHRRIRPCQRRGDDRRRAGTDRR